MTLVTFLQAAGVAMIPSLVWGWFFVSRNPESRQLVIVTFLLGTLAVVPLLLFMAGWASSSRATRRPWRSKAAGTSRARRSACSRCSRAWRWC